MKRLVPAVGPHIEVVLVTHVHEKARNQDGKNPGDHGRADQHRASGGMSVFRFHGASIRSVPHVIARGKDVLRLRPAPRYVIKCRSSWTPLALASATPFVFPARS